MITLEIDKKPDKDWNKRLISSIGGNIYQTKEFAVHLQRQGQKPLFIKFINEKGKIISQLLINNYSRFRNKGAKGKLLNKLPGLSKDVFSWTYGPVFFDEIYLNDVYSELGKLLISKKCRVLGKTNPIFSGDTRTLKKNFQLVEWATFLIDLRIGKEAIIANIDKHSGRKNIERSVKRGVTVEEITGKNIGDYVNLKNKMNEENQNLIKVEDMLDSWRLLKPIGYGGIIARLGEIVTGGLFFSSFNGLIIEGGVARSKEDYEMKLYSQDLIKWKIIEWGIENNMKYYDLAGYNPHPKTAKEEGIKRYKAKWGGVSKPYWFIKK